MFLLYAAAALGLWISAAHQRISALGIETEDFGTNGNFVGLTHPRTHLKGLDVVCAKDHMTVHIEFDEPFNGVVFSQPGKHHHRCVHVGPHARVLRASFTIAYDSCGTTEDLRGQFHENTIIIQFGEDVLEAWDEAKRLRCEWLETYEKPSSDQAFHVADLDVVELNFRGDDIDCWMEIQEGKGPWAREVSGLVPLGSPLTIVIAINDHTRQFDMKIKQCKAHDESGSVIDLIDENGCVLRSTLLTPFVKVRDFSNRASLIAYSHLFAFKFPDRLDVYLRCVVEICRHGCTESCLGHHAPHLDPSPRKPQFGHVPGKQPPRVFHAVPFHIIGINRPPEPGRNREVLPVYADSASKSQVTDPQQNFGHAHQSDADKDLVQMLNQLKLTENSLKKHKIEALATLASSSHVPSPYKNIGVVHGTGYGAHAPPTSHNGPETAREPQPEPNSFAHPHHITTEELLKAQHAAAVPQPEPNSFAHPHHITTEELLRVQHAPAVPQPEPNSFAHPHHITTEELLKTKQAPSEPQPEPNSYAHLHHLTSEQFEQIERKKQSFKVNPVPVFQSKPYDGHRQHEPQPEPNSYAHPHHITTEQLEAQKENNNPALHTQFHDLEYFESTRIKSVNKDVYLGGKAVPPPVISVTLQPNGSPVLRYSAPPQSTPPQPAYIPGKHSSGNYTGRPPWSNQPLPAQRPGGPHLHIFPQATFKPRQRHHPYPVPQFSPRQQVMMSVIADRRMDEDVNYDESDNYHHHRTNSDTKNMTNRPPVTGFLLQNDLDNADSAGRRAAQGPRLLRVKRNDQVIGVQQQFRVIAPADLAFELNETTDNAAILKGRREEVIYGVCMSTAKLGISLGLILFLTLCSTVISTVLFYQSQVLQSRKGVTTTSSSTLFMGRLEHLYKASPSKATSDGKSHVNGN